MRATWPGARSGRISITTLPLVVSSVSVFSGLAIEECLSLFAGIVEAEKEWPAGDRIAQCGRHWQRRAALHHQDQRAVIGELLIIRNVARLMGDTRAEDLAVALETQPHGQLH